MKKLTVSKSEGVAEVVERVLSDESGDITLVVPMEAELGKSPANFYLIKREVDLAGKTVLVESVDDGILALAKASGIGASHPLFEGSVSHGPSFSDIVPKRVDKSGEKPRDRKKRKESEEQEEKKRETVTLRVPSGETSEPAEQFVGAGPYEAEQKIYGRRFPRRAVFVAAAVVVLGLVVWFVGGLLARATVEITLTENPWSYEGKFVADASLSKADPAKGLLPAELFSLDKNGAQLFPASGFSEVAEKAKGKIWIYNAFNSSPQTLVATTRFETSDGKIFRIIGQVTVPGAAVKDGKIIPSSIEADMVADKAGPAYNVGPVPRLTIPGFKGSPRFDGFYGEIKEPTNGGFIGKKAVPTADDIKKARERTTEILKNSLEADFASSYPEGFKILPEASSTDIKKLTVDESTDAKGNFSVFGEATKSAIGFREEDLKSALLNFLRKDSAGADFKALKLEYKSVQPNLEKKTLSFTLSAEGVAWPSFSPDDFKAQILGKNVSEIRSLVAGIPGLSRGRVSVWPIWLGKIPLDSSRVKIQVD